MSESYDILKLSANSKEAIEQLGSKPKFWFVMEGDEQDWLFKYSRETAGEDWSEKIAAEVAVRLGVQAAHVELAEFMGKRGSACRSFVQRKRGVGLIHGSEILAGRVLGYDKDKKWNQSDHSIENILSAVASVFPVGLRAKPLRQIAGFVVLDAIVCNTDRHHDNWGVLRGGMHGKPRYKVAPSYDHASSLGRELTDDKRALILKNDGVRNYILKGRGGVYWENTDRRGENPLLLALKAADKYPRYFRPWMDRVKTMDVAEFTKIVNRVPTTLMSDVAKEFCSKMMETTVKILKEGKL